MSRNIWLDNHRSRRTVFSDFFGLEEVLRKIGTDKQFIAWVQTLPSCLSGDFSEYPGGEGRCVAAHVRRARNSGTGTKPAYACVPLTDAEHRLQHQKGETALRPKFWWDEQVDHYRQTWAVRCLREKLRLTGDQDADVSAIEKWIAENELAPLYIQALAA